MAGKRNRDTASRERRQTYGDNDNDPSYPEKYCQKTDAAGRARVGRKHATRSSFIAGPSETGGRRGALNRRFIIRLITIVIVRARNLPH